MLKIFSKIKKNVSAGIKRLETKRGGFTLIETLVAVFIVALALVGPLSIAQKGLASAVLSRDRATAAYLAQDVFEYIHNVRDENWLKDADWINGTLPKDPNHDAGGSRPGLDLCVVDGPVDSGTIFNYCIIDTTLGQQTSVIHCPDQFNCPALLQDTQSSTPTYRFGYQSGWTPTQFTRMVRIIRNKIQGEASRDEALIEVTVKWNSSLGVKTYVINSALYNWY